ncbi:MAG TPA: phosphoglycerate kinase [Alphaproteobacteria bacterium]|nr:phosphoglycerate kinase [Alphaproteobacteria bacterium]
MKRFLTLDDLAAAGKTVLLRADLNVPMKDGTVTDATRIERLVPTIKELAGAGAKVVILSHFGRPRGKEPALTLRPLSKALAHACGLEVAFADDCVGPLAEAAIKNLPQGGLLLLENVRFYPEEEKNDAAFAAELARLGDVYVNDAFSCAHRAHASTEALARLLPAYAGRLMEAELTALEKALEKPQHPVVAIVGGAKISTKLDLLNNLVQKIDILVLGGGMANTFLAALEHPVGKSLCEHEMKDQAQTIMKTATENACRILLPVDAKTAKEFKAHTAVEVRHVEDIRDDDMMLDIGPESVNLIETMLGKARTVLWNGPVGAFETAPFDESTVRLAQTVARLTETGQLVSVAGGGDTVAALAHAGVEEKMTYVSTAGGAFLEWLEGKTLPGVQILFDRADTVRGTKSAAAG